MLHSGLHLWVFGFLLACMVMFFPIWPYSGAWGYSVSGRIAVVLVVFIVLKITKRI